MCGRPGLCPVTLCGSLQHSARPTSSIKSLLLKGREGGGRKGKRRGGKGRGGEVVPPLLGEIYALVYRIRGIVIFFIVSDSLYSVIVESIVCK